ncbi:MAG: carboxypeptidase regulatory-like domain-containing protein, partial [Deltaproteobacteria bacterium]
VKCVFAGRPKRGRRGHMSNPILTHPRESKMKVLKGILTLILISIIAAMSQASDISNSRPEEKVDRTSRTLLRSRGKTISRSDNWQDGYCIIRGTVVRNVDFNRIGHAKMSLTSQKYGTWIVEVEDNGVFYFGNIPAGTYSLNSFNTEGYKDTYYNPQDQTADQPTFRLKERETLQGIRIALDPERPYRKIAGRIIDESGNPITNYNGLRVCAWTQKLQGRRKGHYRQIAVSGAKDGIYELNTLDGRDVYLMVFDWEAAQKDDPYPPTFYPGTPSRAKATLITFGDEDDVIENIDIRMKKEGGKILEGTVTDKETGQPISQAMVTAYHSDMFYDLFPTYTDEKGRYKFRSFGDGEYIIHADARHKGYVKHRQFVNIPQCNTKERLDFQLDQGISISGRFVDQEQNELAIKPRSSGYASVKTENRTGNASNFPVPNKFAPPYMQKASTVWYNLGQGNSSSAFMCFPTETTFLIPAIPPGETSIFFRPGGKGEKVKEILYQGKTILRNKMETENGKDLKDITIVIKG